MIEPWEVELMLEEGEKLIPGFKKARVLRAWAGVRPLYQEGFKGSSRDATRALTLLDHKERDGISGFLTITGGKWTTFRRWQRRRWTKPVNNWASPVSAKPPRQPCPASTRGTTGWDIGCTKSKRIICRTN